MTSLQISATLVAVACLLSGCSRDSDRPPAPGDPAPRLTPAAGSSAGPGPRCTSNVRSFDGDGDGRVTRREFLDQPHYRADPEAVFEARDANADDALSLDEFCSWRRGDGGATGPSWRRTWRGQRIGPSQTAPEPERPESAAPPATPRFGCSANFQRLDADSDGVVSEDEFTAVPHRRGSASELFRERDANSDGKLDLTELCSGPPW